MEQHNDDPVFVDRTGRRRRLTAVLGTAGGLLLSVVLFALVAGFTGVGPVSVPGWPEAAGGKPRATSPSPSPSPTSVPATRPRTRTAAPAAVRPTTTRPAATATTVIPAPPTSASAGPQPSVSVTPTPKNNGRRPSHTPKPHPKKG